MTKINEKDETAKRIKREMFKILDVTDRVVYEEGNTENIMSDDTYFIVTEMKYDL